MPRTRSLEAKPEAQKMSHKKKPSKIPKSKKTNALSTCQVNGAGWCAYPFSVKQLERRLRAKQLQKTALSTT